MKDVTVFFAAVDWFVMATKAETFGMVTIESLASGTPVLGSNAGGTPEILNGNEGGELFTTLDSTDLAKKIDEIIDNNIQPAPNDLKEMAKVYDHDKVCEAVEKALNLI
jgi:glycosyltransferase involved in cell wall biosynthesis